MIESDTGRDLSPALPVPIVVELSLDSIEVLAEAMARRLGAAADHDDDDRNRDRHKLITASELARRIGRSATWVRQHRRDLGGIVLGDGPKPRIWFDPSRVAETLASCSASRESDRPESPEKPASRLRARRSPLGTDYELLPIRPPKPSKPSPAGDG